MGPSPSPELPEPPADPEDWSDEQWLAWLEATDGGEEPEARPRLARWRDRPVSSALGAAMLGLRDAIYGRPDDEVVIVQQAGGDPPDGEIEDLYLDPDHPERSQFRARHRGEGGRDLSSPGADEDGGGS